METLAKWKRFCHVCDSKSAHGLLFAKRATHVDWDALGTGAIEGSGKYLLRR